MTDLACLRGLSPSLASIPSIIYFHENQFAYPASTKGAAAHRLEPQMVQLYSALAAARVVFNSAFNRDSFLSGVRQLLAKLPDGVPKGTWEHLAGKSCVVPVPIEPITIEPKTFEPKIKGGKDSERFHVVWNHRWEYDKGPSLLLQILRRLDANMPLRVHVIGQQFRAVPEPFAEIGELLRKRGWLGHWGFIEDRRYYTEILRGSHLVLSTARHDFQGLAVLEAVSAGCLPVVPRLMVYPEHFASQYLYAEDDADDACRIIDRAVQQFCRGENLLIPNVEDYYWHALTHRYQELIAGVTNS